MAKEKERARQRQREEDREKVDIESQIAKRKELTVEEPLRSFSEFQSLQVTRLPILRAYSIKKRKESEKEREGG